MIKIKQLGRNLIIKDGDLPTLTVTMPEGYNTDKLFSLAFKSNSENKTAYNLFLKELQKLKKPEKVNQEKIDKKLIKNKIKKLQGFDYKSLPLHIPDEWKELIDSKEDNQYLINFLTWLSLSDNEYTRNNFLKSFDAKYCYITPSGFIAALRQVYKKEENDSLYDFIHSQWIKIKTSWKKSPKNYSVWENNNKFELILSTPTDSSVGGYLGNLNDLYINYKPTKKTSYESDYQRRNPQIYQEEWNVGDTITMPDKATHGNICGVRQYHILQNPHDVLTEVHGKYGDTIALVLVNPAHVISIEAGWKFTCDEWKFCAIMDKEDVKQQFNEQWGLFDYDYLNETVDEIKDNLIEQKAQVKIDQNKAEIILLQEKLKVLNNVITSETKIGLEEVLKNRVKTIN